MAEREAPRGSAWKRARWGLLAILVAAGVIYLLIWYGPDALARHDIGNVTGPLRALRLQEARDAARGRLLTLGAGLFAAGALIYTARNFTLARRQLELSQQAMRLTEAGQRRTLELTEQGQVTDRYTKAIEQLGSNTIDVTIGGIYALERIARDSPRDQPTVMEVLAAFIREHSREQWPTPGSDGITNQRSTRPDIQAALTVIGRRDPERDIRPINLSSADFTRANLTSANLSGADLDSVDLTDANLRGANLTGADLKGVQLLRGNLKDARLANADFQPTLVPISHAVGELNPGFAPRYSDLRAARLIDADLTGVNLQFAQLTQALLMGAILRRAILTGTNLTSADLTRTDLTGAVLGDADATGANLTDANLAGAYATDMTLAHANLAHANLGGANLMGANLTHTNLTKADLGGANLAGANLTSAVLTGAALTDALWPSDAVVPEGWQRDPDSGRLMRAPADADDATTN